MNRIKRNMAQCRRCGDVIESKFRHDMQECSCGAIAIDGGKDYIKLSGNINDYRDLCEYEETEE